jgi:anthranilate phosphoribosyltransferase
MAVTTYLEQLAAGNLPNREHSKDLMRHLVSGETPPAQISGTLMALRVLGVGSEQLIGFVQALRGQSVQHQFGISNLVDTCGTGGGRPSFNISTTSAFLAAGAGAKVAKHGNRGVTSKCGSADVLEALGVDLSGDHDYLKRCLDSAGVCFMFAPAHHPAMRHVGPVRQELGVRTVFNQLGPLLNPAGAKRQVIGVYQADLVRPMAEALAGLGSDHALVVYGRDDMDEISPCTETLCCEVKDDQITERELTPAEFGMSPVSVEDLMSGDDAASNAEILREAISSSSSGRFRSALPGAAAAVYVSGLADSLDQAADAVRGAVDSGRALASLRALIEASASE